ncbi:hypothetical protein CF326_g8838 [Tilletia indica]|uniref:FHA domain-containing protein n=1 Tax=Tilletia indica TaxID=43049 RepID=A0A177T2Q3_9BASI|nr:hypothetical protein CF326_g8838 [Tilletia indica]KAE8237816.1 hypothetical protein A4X13_0g8629 [Tilletia indica]
MPSPSVVRVLTLRPISFPSQQQSVAFCRSDTFTLLFGGTHRSDRYGALACPVRSADFHFDDQFICPDHATIAVSSGQALIHQHRKEDPIRVNERMLADDQQAQLRDGDLIELGHLDEYDGDFRRNSAFQVFLTDPSAMVQHNRQALPAVALLPLAPNLLATLAFEAESVKQLRSDLQHMQQQLQDALDVNKRHICSPTQPPRPYDALLADLRAQSTALEDAPWSCRPLASSAPTSPSSSPSSSPLRDCKSISSSSDGSASLADSSGVVSASATESLSASGASSSSTSPSTSVLTPVLCLESHVVPTTPAAPSSSITPSSTSVLTSVLPPIPPAISREPSSSSPLALGRLSHDAPDVAAAVPATSTFRPGGVDAHRTRHDSLNSPALTTSAYARMRTVDRDSCSRSPTTSTPYRSLPSQLPSSYAATVSSMDVALTRVGAGWIQARREVIRLPDHPAPSSPPPLLRIAYTMRCPIRLAVSAYPPRRPSISLCRT